MREILFRAKRLGNGEWVEGSLIAAPNYTCILQNEDKVHPMDYPYLDGWIGTFDGKATPVALETVCQYTGRTDKNGVKIFDGDIVKDDVIFGAVVWDSPYVGFVIHDVHDGPQEYSNWWHELAVVGNIFDNPELLKGGAE